MGAFATSVVNEAAASRALRTESFRVHAGAQQVYPPFDIDPGSFMSTLEAIPTDVLILFHSRTCHDCTKILPQWVQVAHEFQDRNNLTLLTIADPRGLAPDPYGHDDIPAVFFAQKGRRMEPSVLLLDDIHAFTYTEETPATEAAIRLAIEGLVTNHSSLAKDASAKGAAVPAALAAPMAAPKAAAAEATDQVTLTARFLSELKKHEAGGLPAQLEVLRSKVYASLPVAKFLLSQKLAAGGEPLAVVAARFLDSSASPTSAT